jgi:hypothetical protein
LPVLWLPLVALVPLQAPLPVQAVVSVLLQVRVLLLLALTVPGLVLKDKVGADVVAVVTLKAELWALWLVALSTALTL